jgi:[calcium/calmodulin-dependent protein kinase] kinase
MRPSGLRKSRSHDTDDRRTIDYALTTEGIHHEIEIDNDIQRRPSNPGGLAKLASRSATIKSRPQVKGPIPSSPLSPQPVAGKDVKVVHENMSHRSQVSKPITIPSTAVSSAPTTPLGKGHAHDPLQDTLFLNIGTGEDASLASEESCIVSESPSAVDIDIYDTAYREEVDRIVKRREVTPGAGPSAGRRPTLYLTRRVEDVKSILSDNNDCIFDHGKSPTEAKTDLKGGFKSLIKKAKEDIEARGELQKLNEGKEGKLSRITRNVREAKRAVEEEREIIRREDREKGRGKTLEKEREKDGSRSSTPAASLRGLSRSGTPVS